MFIRFWATEPQFISNWRGLIVYFNDSLCYTLLEGSVKVFYLFPQSRNGWFQHLLLLCLRRFYLKSVAFWRWGVTRLPDRKCWMKMLWVATFRQPDSVPTRFAVPPLGPEIESNGTAKDKRKRKAEKCASFRLLLNNRRKSRFSCVCKSVCEVYSAGLLPPEFSTLVLPLQIPNATCLQANQNVFICFYPGGISNTAFSPFGHWVCESQLYIMRSVWIAYVWK